MAGILRLVSGLYRRSLEERGALDRGERIVLDLLAEHPADALFAREVALDGRGAVAVLGDIAVEFRPEKGVGGTPEDAGDASRRIPEARFLAVTDLDSWDFYEVVGERGEPVLRPLAVRASLAEATALLGRLLSNVVPRIPAGPGRVERLFTVGVGEKILGPLREALDEALASARDLVGPLYEAYKKIVVTLYGDVPEDFFKDLFVRHTAVQMIVLASLSKALGLDGDPVDLCGGSGLEIDLALPYLSWWRLALDGLERTGAGVREAAEEIAARASLVDWRAGGAEDVFRTLYEVLVDPGTRRRMGEYYTPLWIVEMILENFDLKGKIVMDPFCGSGTFLVAAFHRKVERGEDPDEALGELVGFDANPVAVAVARAELVLAYFRRTGRAPGKPPRVYHMDTLAAWFGSGSRAVPGLAAVFGADDVAAGAGPWAAGAGVDSRDVLGFLAAVESSVARALRSALAECGLERGCLSERMGRHVRLGLQDLDGAGGAGLADAFLDHVVRTGLLEGLANLLIRSRGGAWGSIVASLCASKLLHHIRPHVVATNPPWLPVLKLRAEYGDRLRGHIMSRARALGIRGLGNVDVAVAVLSKSLEVSGEGAGIVMGREQAFCHRTPMRAGIVATYSILRDFGGDVALVDVDHDAFGHGVRPALVIARRSGGGGRRLRILRVVEGCGKEDGLRGCRADLVDFEADYDDYVAPSLAYFSESLDRLAQELGVRRVVAEGLYIAGLYGGERKRGSGRYAGLVVEDFSYEGGALLFKLYGTARKLRAPVELLKDHGARLYTLIYMGEIRPFGVRPLKILLSDKGPEHLRTFLEKVLASSHEIGEDDVERIRGLIKELRQPQTINAVRRGLHYSVYRCNRTFTAAAVDPEAFEDDVVMDHHTSALECDTREKALYYAAALNYLAYKVVERNMGFARSQFARPAMALAVAGLSWNRAGKAERSAVAGLAEKAIETADERVDPRTQRKALKILYARNEHFRKIVEIFDGLAEDLDGALALVAEGRERPRA